MTVSTIPEGANPLLFRRATLNPYRFALRVLRDRLLWDFSIHSWVSRRKLRALRNKHAGQKAVIVCNGPSLNQTDLSLLKGIFTFGLNKINLLFERSEFRPSCIVSVNPFVIEQNKTFFAGTPIPLFLDSAATKLVPARDNMIFLNGCSEPRLARDCSISVQQGFTVTVVAMQLAYHMGFTNVSLIGCDHSFAGSGQSNEVVRSGKEDANHFDPRYFSGGQKWQMPDLLGSEYFYKLAQESFEADGRRLVNCTVGGQLKIFPRITLEDWVKSAD